MILHHMIKSIFPEIEIYHIVGKNTSNNLETGRNSYLINMQDIKDNMR